MVCKMSLESLANCLKPLSKIRKGCVSKMGNDTVAFPIICVKNGTVAHAFYLLRLKDSMIPLVFPTRCSTQYF